MSENQQTTTETETQTKTESKAKNTSLTEKVVGNFTSAELVTLQQTIAKGTTKEQFNLFVQICVNSGLNPFLNHVFCVTYKTKSGDTVMSVQVAVEGILYLARQKHGYKGVEAQLVHENDEFRLGRENGILTVVQHDINGFSRGRILGGYAIAKREGFDDVLVLMQTNEVEHLKKGRNSDMWNNYFQDMFKKHMIKRAAKLQYGIEINEDMPVEEAASFDEYQTPERKDITPAEPAAPVVEVEEGQRVSEDDLMQQQWNLISEHMETYGLERSEVTGLVNEKFNKKSKELTLPQLVALTKFVEAAGKEKQQEKAKAEAVEMKPTNEISEMESLFATAQ